MRPAALSHIAVEPIEALVYGNSFESYELERSRLERRTLCLKGNGSRIVQRDLHLADERLSKTRPAFKLPEPAPLCEPNGDQTHSDRLRLVATKCDRRRLQRRLGPSERGRPSSSRRRGRSRRLPGKARRTNERNSFRAA